MTNKEAVKILLTGMYRDVDKHIAIDSAIENDFLCAIGMAVSVLMKQEEESRKTVWHDAKTEPPKTPGVYYGRKDDTNSMYLCSYRDGKWTLKGVFTDYFIDIIYWAEYADFKLVD